MIYYRILDRLNQNEVIRCEAPGAEYQYAFGEVRWVRSDIMAAYDGRRGQYEEIPAEQAAALLEQQRILYQELLLLADRFAEKAHEGQVDKGGNPYIGHPRAVAASLTNTEYKIIALLHDICEDTPYTTDDLLNMGFTFRIVNSVRLLTKTPLLTEEAYWRRLRSDSGARAVKIADLTHNSDLSRIPHPTEKDYARVEKYRRALAFLQDAAQNKNAE